MNVDICVATYKRPAMLLVLLESLSQLEANGNNLTIIVVDNSPETEGRDVVSSYERSGGKLEIIYILQPEKNISLTRNMALDNLSSECDVLCFVDDDEYVSVSWLREMLKVYGDEKADVVFGPVVTVYPNECQEWIQRSGLFERERRETGTVLRHGFTGNVLFNASIARMEGFRFSANFGLTGGEDTDFFKRLNDAGKRLVWCDSALVYEPLDMERANASWIFKRAYSNGQKYGRIYDVEENSAFRLLIKARYFLYFLIAVSISPLVLLLRQSRGIKILQFAFSSLGRVFVFDRAILKIYK
ncbi:MAG: glycosyltransferase [Gammaproteobacteria bacterium]|nr:glycosyltransferase [Gammaproteobacteria bacterium]